MSRQDNFSFWRVSSSLGEMYLLMLIVALDFLIYFICQFSLLSFFSWWYFLFLLFVVFVGGVYVYVYLFITIVSCSVYFECAGSLGVSLAGRVTFLFIWGSAAWSVGPVQFIWALAWGGWRDCTGFSFLWRCCSGYGTIEIVGEWSVFSFHFLQFAVSSLGVRLSVVGLRSFIAIFFGYIFVLFAVSYFIGC